LPHPTQTAAPRTRDSVRRASGFVQIFIALTDPGSLIPIKSRQGFPLRIHIANCDTTQLSLSQFFIFIVLQIMDGPFSVSAKYAA
jgi:hypothetical protein